jgi:hypothetical protein
MNSANINNIHHGNKIGGGIYFSTNNMSHADVAFVLVADEPGQGMIDHCNSGEQQKHDRISQWSRKIDVVVGVTVQLFQSPFRSGSTLGCACMCWAHF